jgi:tetratricopeptide (TPR) repeat protein
MAATAAAAISAARSAVVAALRSHDRADAISALARLTALYEANPGNNSATRARAQAELGDLCALLGEYASSRGHYDRAIEWLPAEPRYWFNRAAVRRFLGELEGAEQDYDRAVSLDYGDAMAYLNRSELRVQTPARNHIEALERVLRSSLQVWQREVPIRYALAKEYEDLGDYAHAWEHLRAGSALRRRQLQYNVRVDLDTVDWIRAAFAADNAVGTGSAGHSQAGCDSEEPIFIIGMPRTGSTLVDRILSSHSDVFGAGELPDFTLAVVAAVRRQLGRDAARQELIQTAAMLDAAALGSDYLRRTRPRTGRTARFTDKLPINYLYAGLIARALPQARIVHVTRDPVATCYGIYRVLFEQGYPFSYDLVELADYYVGYRRLMDHWHASMPGRIIDFSYEALVEDASTQVAQLLQSVGLSWQSACLGFHSNPAPVATASAAQVRRPIYSSAVNRWRYYERELQPLITRLRAAGIATS